MNTATIGESLPGRDIVASDEHPALVPPDERGQLTINDRVVEKVAGHAVTLVTDAAAAPRRMLGLRIGEARPQAAASVQARVQGDIASIQAAIAVRWPRSVQRVADEARQRIRSEVADITGVRVDHVDVEVVLMTMPSAEPRVR